MIKAVMPRPWQRLARRWIAGAVYEGDYSSWAEAAAVSSGYDADLIFQRTLEAARAVRDGRATWERDTVLFHEPVCHEPLMRQLRRIATAGGRLSVLDFGGALGSTWWQHRPWLAELGDVRWSVVEQSRLVEAGRREFTRGPLRFYATMGECCAAERPDVLLLSSVLPYLESPEVLMTEIAARGFQHVIIDRTGFVGRGRHRLTVQHVPKEIYPASYPCWFFDRETLLGPMAANWRVVDEWVAFGDVDIDAEYRGLALERRSS
jgi:putative methyltransferase (TIGR04325 family)